MKAILIDAANKQIREVTIDENKDQLTQYYDLIGCQYIEGVYFTKTNNCCFVDEEGLLNNPKDFFAIEGGVQPYAGNGLIVGTNKNGDTIDTTFSVEDISKMVMFYNHTH